MLKEPRKNGRILEESVCHHLIELGLTTSRPSKGSGNRGEAGDIAGQNIFTVECKQRTTKDITIKEDVWRKLCAEIPLHSKRLPLYVLENMNKRQWCVMEMKDFFTVVKGYLENERRKEAEEIKDYRQKTK